MMRATHKGHEIEFDEATEQWKCGEFALADTSLHRLKFEIDKASKERRTVSVPALHLEETWNGDPTLRNCTITLLRDGEKKAQITVAGQKRSEQADLDSLYAIGERAKLDAYVTAKKESVRAEARASKLGERLKPLTAQRVRELVARQADEQS